MLEAARKDASEALARTTAQLPALRSAGVVDAGGAGLVLLSKASCKSSRVGRSTRRPYLPDGQPRRPAPAPPGPAHPWASEAPDEAANLRYEVMFFLEAPDESIPAFRSVWAGYGGSIVIVGGGGLYNCHIHTDDIGGAIEAAIEIGRPREIRVTDLAEQVEEERWVREAAAAATSRGATSEPVTSAVVAVARAKG